MASLAICVASSRVGEITKAPMVFFDSSPEKGRFSIDVTRGANPIATPCKTLLATFNVSEFL